jgi:hypothetical protein
MKHIIFYFAFLRKAFGLKLPKQAITCTQAASDTVYLKQSLFNLQKDKLKLLVLRALVRGSEYALSIVCLILGLNELAKVIHLVKYFFLKKG